MLLTSFPTVFRYQPGPLSLLRLGVHRGTNPMRGEMMSSRSLPTLRTLLRCEKLWKGTLHLLLLDRSCKRANLSSMAVIVIRGHAAQAILMRSEKSLRVFDAAKTRWSEGELPVSSVLDVFEKDFRITAWTHLGVLTQTTTPTQIKTFTTCYWEGRRFLSTLSDILLIFWELNEY